MPAVPNPDIALELLIRTGNQRGVGQLAEDRCPEAAKRNADYAIPFTEVYLYNIIHRLPTAWGERQNLRDALRLSKDYFESAAMQATSNYAAIIDALVHSAAIALLDITEPENLLDSIEVLDVDCVQHGIERHINSLGVRENLSYVALRVNSLLPRRVTESNRRQVENYRRIMERYKDLIVSVREKSPSPELVRQKKMETDQIFYGLPQHCDDYLALVQRVNAHMQMLAGLTPCGVIDQFVDSLVHRYVSEESLASAIGDSQEARVHLAGRMGKLLLQGKREHLHALFEYQKAATLYDVRTAKASLGNAIAELSRNENYAGLSIALKLPEELIDDSNPAIGQFVNAYNVVRFAGS